jgi:hypothetical protein
MIFGETMLFEEMLKPVQPLMDKAKEGDLAASRKLINIACGLASYVSQRTPDEFKMPEHGEIINFLTAFSNGAPLEIDKIERIAELSKALDILFQYRGCRARKKFDKNKNEKSEEKRIWLIRRARCFSDIITALANAVNWFAQGEYWTPVEILDYEVFCAAPTALQLLENEFEVENKNDDYRARVQRIISR